MHRGAILCGVFLALTACRSRPPGEEASRSGVPASSSSAATRPAPQAFGAKIQSAEQTSVATVLEQPERYAGKSVVVEGHVSRACSRKGCWMELAATADPSAPRCRVTFKDYGFFVPTDSAGARARVEAVVELAQLEPRHVDHLEREGAEFAAKGADGSAREVRLVASGVELSRGP